MMVLSALRPDASIFEFLGHRARSASPQRLAADVLAGAGIFAAAFQWESNARLAAASAATCFVAYGIWGLIDRVRSRPPMSRWPRIAGLLDALCALAATVGVVAAAAGLFAIWAIALGTWIS